MKFNFLFNFIVASTIVFGACQTESPRKIISEISLERWAVSGDTTSYMKDSILYLETKKFNKDGILEATIFYTPNKQLKAQELRIFKNNLGPIGSQYKDASDNILSYYTFKTNKEGLVTESKAFDGQSNELLRIENFEYNRKGKLLKKITKDASESIVRQDIFTLDSRGNEQQVQLLKENGDEILTEIFRITKYDGQKNWTEKWGFVNDKPFSFLARRVKYY